MFVVRPCWDRMRADEMIGASGLIFSSDHEPGWQRRRRGKSYSYFDSEGQSPAPERRAEINALAIPPAWSQVWICKDCNGHIQATGRDERGRKQYRYHPDWTTHRASTKFDGLVSFATALPALRNQVDEDLRRRGLSLDRVAASVVWLLDNSLIRVGNPTYARENKSFGLTTLRNRHVAINGQSIRFKFKGKSGKDWNLQLVDRRMARIVKSLQDLPGQDLFQYEDETGYHAISSRDVNDYIAGFAGPGYSSKHFRTWAGTVRAFGLLAGQPIPESQRAQTKLLTGIVDVVANRLGNTRAVCRQSYIHPAVFENWQAGTLIRSNRLRPIEGLDEDERATLAFLKKLAA
ncbi:DNA topoisomerase-1 [Devosia crocina]|uniref:DNA topoisomerase n=1 Tax=Devosia crocina TaxID=429728 RepID=A0A1I7NNL6_9HYPH|nr:DNA topoisomerase IB [Devosia crocina]SFV36170.1 DNA topoisomerase-1 [Devosia crocina]